MRVVERAGGDFPSAFLFFAPPQITDFRLCSFVRGIDGISESRSDFRSQRFFINEKIEKSVMAPVARFFQLADKLTKSKVGNLWSTEEILAQQKPLICLPHANGND
jgi:hypothetical protein